MKFGRFDVTLHNLGFFRLDGGAMFGSVPKNLWAKRIQPDDENTIRLATRVMLIRDEKRSFLVDVGMGEKWDEKARRIFGIQNSSPDEWGFEARDVSDVILTHLHFDHAGGISRYKKGTSDVELVFSRAQVFLQESNLQNAKAPNVKERASYLPENVQCLEEAMVSLVSGDIRIYPDIWLHQIDGHTVGQQWVEVRDGNQSLMYATDLVPTSHHLPVPFHMGYDINAGALLKEKEQFLSRAVETNSIVVFEHDPEIPAARITKDAKGHFCVREVVPFS